MRNIEDFANTKNIIYVDCQSTGAHPLRGHLLEIAWASENTIETHHVQQPASEPIPRRIRLLTGIKDADLEGAPAPDEVAAFFKKFIEERAPAKMIIHFSRFETPFLQKLFAPDSDFDFSKIPIYCTHRIARRLLPALPSKGIRGLAGYFGSPVAEMKRAGCHVQATQSIWTGIVELLKKKEIRNFAELDLWLLHDEKIKKSKYEYPMDRSKRLGLPDCPGIYRMRGQTGNVLYIGKATSLKTRVNSYFRGQKGRNSSKLEMLTQVWDIDVTCCALPIEAALLEVDEIKKFDPPYNHTFKKRERSLAFYSRDFASASEIQSEENSIGPFAGTLVIDAIKSLQEAVRTDNFSIPIFFDDADQDPNIVQEGVEIFFQQQLLSVEKLKSLRSLLAIGMQFLRTELREQRLASKLKLTDKTTDEASKETSEEASEVQETDEVEILDSSLTAEEVADRVHRLLKSGARAYRRTKQLTKLLNSHAEVQGVHLRFIDGQRILNEESVIRHQVRGRAWTNHLWLNHGIDTYDRMAVLQSELAKCTLANSTFAAGVPGDTL